MAYTLVAGLFAATGLAHTWSAVVDFLDMCGAHPAAWADDAEPWLLRLATAGAGSWLIYLHATSPQLRRRAWLMSASIASTGICMAAYAGDAAGLFTDNGDPNRLVGPLLQLMLLVCLTLTVLTRAGIRLREVGIRSAQHTPVTAARCVPVALATFTCLSIAQLIWQGLMMLPGPVLQGDQATAAGAPNTQSLAVLIFWSSVVEELIITAAVVALLAAARRPLWECLTISALLRAIPHLYVGLPALAALVLGLACAWILYRYGHVLALIAAHLTFDMATPQFLLPDRWALPTIGALTLAGLVSAVLLWRKRHQHYRPDFSPISRREPHERQERNSCMSTST